jgi:long-subunit acyl-CoA synthetase (AMP-forming)
VSTIISGGSSDATNAVQNAQFLGHFPGVTNFLIGYGMTEIVLISHMTPLDIGNDDQRRLHSVGKLLPGFEYKVKNMPKLMTR